MTYHNARLLATAQLTAVSSPVVQRHTPWNRKARVRGVGCEAFAPHTANSRCAKPAHHTPQSSSKASPCHAYWFIMMYDVASLHVTAQMIAVSFPVVQRHTPWNRKARVCGLWCEAFAPRTAKSQSETPPFVPLHHGMTEAFSGGCSTTILTSPCVMHVIHDDSS